MVDVHRLGDEVERALADGGHRIGAVRIAAGDDDLGARIEGKNIAQRAKTFGRAVRVGRQAKIQHHDAEPAIFAEQADRFLAGSRRHGLIGGERPGHLALQADIVLHQQNLLGQVLVSLVGVGIHHVHRQSTPVLWVSLQGSEITMLVPRPSALNTSKLPPSLRTFSRA